MIQFGIYQIKDIENCDYAFRPYREGQFNLKDYECQYSGNVDELGFPKALYPELYESTVLGKTVAEACFTRFNLAHPVDFKGHSLSVSDVVKVQDEHRSRLYYCDFSGWVSVQ